MCRSILHEIHARRWLIHAFPESRAARAPEETETQSSPQPLQFRIQIYSRFVFVFEEPSCEADDRERRRECSKSYEGPEEAEDGAGVSCDGVQILSRPELARICS